MSDVQSNRDSQVAQLRRMIQSSPLLLPWSWNRITNHIDFVSLSESDYLQASFLDERVLTQQTLRGSVPYALISDLFSTNGWPDSAPCCDFIFHISHCGSTLLSRLLGLHPSCFALREPRILRSFNSQTHTEILWLFFLLSRTYRESQRSLIKATSFTSHFAKKWLTVLFDSKAIHLTLRLEPFLASVIDGSPTDIQNHMHARWDRLLEMGIPITGTPPELTLGQSAAMTWLCESLTLDHLASTFKARTLHLDFEDLIRLPDESLNRCAAFLNYSEPYPKWSQHALWQEYAKKPGVVYNSEIRSRILNASRKKYASEIRQGIDWISEIQDLRVANLLNQ